MMDDKIIKEPNHPAIQSLIALTDSILYPKLTEILTEVCIEWGIWESVMRYG